MSKIHLESGTTSWPKVNSVFNLLSMKMASTVAHNTMGSLHNCSSGPWRRHIFGIIVLEFYFSCEGHSKQNFFCKDRTCLWESYLVKIIEKAFLLWRRLPCPGKKCDKKMADFMIGRRVSYRQRNFCGFPHRKRTFLQKRKFEELLVGGGRSYQRDM